MRAILMAGGKGTRLNGYLKSKFTNKHSLLLRDRPMIEWPVKTLASGGVADILVLLDGPHPESIMEILEDGCRFNIHVTYKYVTEGRSPGRDLLMARDWARGERVIVMLGDSIFFSKIDFTSATAPHIWITDIEGIDDPAKYGQVQVDGHRVIKLVEKPSQLFSNNIQTGVWLFPPDVFNVAYDLSKQIERELHIGRISQYYVEGGRTSYTTIPKGSYLDVGTRSAFINAAQKLNGKSRRL